MLDMNFIGFCITIKIFSGNFGLKNFIPTRKEKVS